MPPVVHHKARVGERLCQEFEARLILVPDLLEAVDRAGPAVGAGVEEEPTLHHAEELGLHAGHLRHPAPSKGSVGQ